MKHLIPLLIAAVAAPGVCAQYKISPAGMMMIDDYHEAVAKSVNGNRESSVFTKSIIPDPEVAVIVRFTADGYAPSLEENGFSVLTDLDDMAIVRLHLSEVERLAGFDFVQSVSFGEQMRAMLDFARPSGSVSSVQNGFSYDGSTLSFDGRGVVVGMMDQGLEANHINFIGEDGKSRIQRLWHMNSTNGSYVMYTPDDISGFSTDMSSESHATHVGGILGGSYRGPATYFQLSGPGSGSGMMYNNSGSLPYYGVATGADLAFSVGTFQDANVAVGVSNILDYAKQVGKPAVVNLSLGSTTGPHDGTDNLTATLSRLGKQGIICISSGNEGDSNMSIERKFTSLTKEVKTGLADNKGNGIVDIWGKDNQPMTVTWSIYNTSDRSNTEIISITSAGQTKNSSSVSAFTTYFNGSIKAQSLVDPNNNRFRVYCDLSGVSVKTTSGNTRYIVLTVTGAKDQAAYIYGNKITFARNNITGSTNGTPAGSINNLACGDNLISVGSYNSRITWPVLGSNNTGAAYQYSSQFAVNDISPFSSYGSTFQGVKLPLVAGPGAAIVSSYSSYYINAGKEPASDMTAKVSQSNRTYYWGRMQGTSMSCPFVAGTVALWLQADPTLTYADVMEAINQSSVKDAYVEDSPSRWGAGKIDALEGIKYVLANRAAIGSVFADNDERLVVNVAEGSVTAFVAGASQLTARLYSLGGSTVAIAAGADSAEISTASIGSGVYILSVDSDEGRFTRKIIVK